MKFIKIFLASSITEFENERRQLGDFIRSLNDTYVKRGIYFELTICENLDNALSMERKQQEYNNFIKDSQYFYVMFGKKAGEYTIEEFNVALEQFLSSGSPRIYTYFLRLSEGEQPEQSVVDFMERLDKQIGHYYSTFVHMDAIKLNLLLELVRDPELNSEIKFEDGQAVLNEQPILSLEHVPLYSKNEVVQKLLKEQQKLNEEFACLALEYGKNPENSKTLEKMMKLGEERTRISDSLHQMEMDMLGLCSQAAEKRRSGKPLNWREKKAIECVDLGDYEGAKNILRDAQWEREIDQAEERIDAAKESVREYISGKKSLISTLMATGLNVESLEEIYAIYERCCDLARKHGVGLTILYDYANFLFSQHSYPRAIAIGEVLYGYCGKEPEFSDSWQARLALLLGGIYYFNQDYTLSEAKFREAHEIYRRLAKKEPEIYEKDLSVASASMAMLFTTINRIDEAEELFQEALSIQRSLAKADPKAHERRLASICNDYGILLGKTDRLAETEKLCREVLEIYRRWQTDEPESQNDIARSCLNLANILERNYQLEEAEALGRESLEIRKKLTTVNPEKYQSELAFACNNLSVTLKKLDRWEEAEALYREGLTLRKRLAQVNPQAYLSDVALSCSNLATLLAEENRLEEAEALYKEALEIQRKLALSASPAYEEGLAKGCINMASFLRKVYRLEEARALYAEAYDIYCHLTEVNPEAFEAPKADTCFRLGEVLKIMMRLDEAEPYYEEAISTQRRLKEKNPKAYTVCLQDSLVRFGMLLGEGKRTDEAEKMFQEALSICLSLVRENPELYENKLAGIYDNLGVLWKDRKPEKADEVLKKALDIYERLAVKHPQIYMSEKARVSFDLARLRESQRKFEEAETLYEEVWNIYHDLAKESTEAWYPYVSSVSYNLFRIKKSLGKWEEAERCCREAYKVDQDLAALNPSIYWKYSAESGSSLADLLSRNPETSKEAKEVYLEVLNIYKAHPGHKKEEEHIESILRI